MDNYLQLAQSAFEQGKYLQAAAYIEVAYHQPDSNDFVIQLRTKYLNAYSNYLAENTVSENKIAIYTICKNETTNVLKWFNSVKQADYIVVLDTGSTDDTYEQLLGLAKANPGRVIVAQQTFNPWRFDLARNIAMSYIPKDANICISLDLDEEITPEYYDVLKQSWVPDLHQRALYTYFWAHDTHGRPAVSYKYDKIHSKEWLWQFPVHESLFNVNTLKQRTTADIQVLSTNKFAVHHYQLDKDRNNYLPLMELRQKEYTNDAMGIIYLLRAYGALARYNDFILLYNKTMQETPDLLKDGELFQAWADVNLGRCYDGSGQLKVAEQLYRKCVIAHPEYMDSYLSLADVLIRQKQFQEAIDIIKQSFIKAKRYFSWLESPGSWTYWPCRLLASAQYALGQKKEAIVSLLKATTFKQNLENLQQTINQILEEISFSDL